MNKAIMKRMGFGEQVDRVERGLCPLCMQVIGEFRDALSKKEYSISGLCQSCQDDVFGAPTGEEVDNG